MNIIEKVYKIIGSLQKRKKTTRTILHHSASEVASPDQIDSWHKQRGWSCIGYHFVIRKDGSIYRGRQEDTVGAHASGANSDSIGICFEGNFEIETMPEVQKEAGKWLIHSYLKSKYGNLKIQKHKDVGNTACPGKNFPFDEIANATVVNEKVIAHVTVTTNDLNIRAGKSTKYKIVGKAYENEEYDIFEISGDWGRTNKGWFNLKYTTYTSNTFEGYKVKVTATVLNVRNGAGTNYKVNTTIRKGEVYTIVEEKNGWGKLKSGAGWISLKYTNKV